MIPVISYTRISIKELTHTSQQAKQSNERPLKCFEPLIYSQHYQINAKAIFKIERERLVKPD